MIERSGRVRPGRLGAGRDARAIGPGRGGPLGGTGAPATLLCTFAVTSHSRAPALARLPVAGVRAAKATVLAQRDAIRVVALALIGLVIAMLALLACEGDSDSDVSAGHVEILRSWRAWTKKTPAQARGVASVARSRRGRARAGERYRS